MTVSKKVRQSLPASRMGLPGTDKYPMPDRSHAANAKARASQQFNAGNLSASQKASIDHKADRILGHNPDNKHLPAHAFHRRRGMK